MTATVITEAAVVTDTITPTWAAPMVVAEVTAAPAATTTGILVAVISATVTPVAKVVPTAALAATEIQDTTETVVMALAAVTTTVTLAAGTPTEIAPSAAPAAGIMAAA